MHETIEFRIAEDRARKFLEPDLGVPLGESLRKIVLPLSDKRVQRIKQLEQEHRRKGGVFFTYWHIHRRYSEKELQAAEVSNGQAWNRATGGSRTSFSASGEASYAQNHSFSSPRNCVQP
ncbi:hypothetical protein POL68_06195 [Stigmatella sp. ncwal1]|uniref:Uncharacterized protein n=1 Tax=Stigmatella ashevillensis TaxID=2995309 RepID=A0ABT5D309_9BACT|nr:hypothetical protein [Stigmatella ashevillena]MDC0708055.1 hypothetical protein [Stigmatella ashevillena]